MWDITLLLMLFKIATLFNILQTNFPDCLQNISTYREYCIKIKLIFIYYTLPFQYDLQQTLQTNIFNPHNYLFMQKYASIVTQSISLITVDISARFWHFIFVIKLQTLWIFYPSSQGSAIYISLQKLTMLPVY